MNSGYFSAETVKDLLAVKEGTISYLTNQNQSLKNQIDLLQQRIKDLEHINSKSY